VADGLGNIGRVNQFLRREKVRDRGEALPRRAPETLERGPGTVRRCRFSIRLNLIDRSPLWVLLACASLVADVDA